MYVVQLGERLNRTHRDWIHAEMAKRGIACGRYFAPIHQQPAYLAETFGKCTLDVTERASERTLALPFFNRITSRQIDEVCRSLGELVEACASSFAADSQG